MSNLHSNPHEDPEKREELGLEKLRDLPIKLPSETKQNTLLAFVIRLHPDLREARNKGYLDEELAAFIQAEFGRVISPGTLRKYMNRAAKLERQPAQQPLDVKRSPSPITSDACKQIASNPLSVDRDKHLHRDTLYSQGTNAHAKSDEFENL